jgi:hypothetical protein
LPGKNSIPILQASKRKFLSKNSAGAKGGIGVFISAVVVGARAEINESNISQNRIKFQVPVSYPIQLPPKKDNP